MRGAPARGRRLALATLMKFLRFLVTLSVTVLVTSCSSSPDERGHDAVDAGSDATDAGTPSNAESSTDAAVDSPDAAACAPSCQKAELCCLDAHGHFPTCRPGPTCP